MAHTFHHVRGGQVKRDRAIVRQQRKQAATRRAIKAFAQDLHDTSWRAELRRAPFLQAYPAGPKHHGQPLNRS